MIREGKKSLESINEAIFHFAKIWNTKHPSQTQTPIFRSNIGGTIFFDVEEYKPYRVANVYEETETYIIYNVTPVHTGLAKRLSAKVILRYESSFEEIADIANEVKDKIKYADVYQNALSESRHRGKPANIIWCYFGYSEDDIIDSNYICHTTWVDNTQDKKWWYRENKNSRVVNNVYLETNPSYEMINQLLHNKVVSRENLIEETHLITEKLVNAAQSFIKLYREYRNGVLSESELIDAVEPLNREITCLFLEQSDLPYPPKELHEWANAHTQLAGTIQDFSLYYDRKNLNTWTTENRIYLMDSSIKRYETDLEALRTLEKHINRKTSDASGHMAATPGHLLYYSFGEIETSGCHSRHPSCVPAWKGSAGPASASPRSISGKAAVILPIVLRRSALWYIQIRFSSSTVKYIFIPPIPFFFGSGRRLFRAGGLFAVGELLADRGRGLRIDTSRRSSFPIMAYTPCRSFIPVKHRIYRAAWQRAGHYLGGGQRVKVR